MLGDLPASGNLLNTCYSFLQLSRTKSAKSQEIRESLRLVKQEWNQKPSILGHLIHITDPFCCLLTPSIVGTFIYSDNLSDSGLGSDDRTRRSMRSCPEAGHSSVWTHADVPWAPWWGRDPAPCLLPHRVPRHRGTAASQDHKEGQYLQHNESMYTWTIPSACFTERRTRSHAHAHTPTLRARDGRRAEGRGKAHASWHLRRGWCPGGGGSEGKRRGAVRAKGAIRGSCAGDRMPWRERRWS